MASAHPSVVDGEPRDLLMGLTWDGTFHSVWVTWTTLLVVMVQQLLFGAEATVGEVAQVLNVHLLSEPGTAHTLGE